MELLELQEKVFGKFSLEIGVTNERLGNLYISMRKQHEAKLHFHRASTIYKKIGSRAE
jgi:hypothetical protein